eukprot:gnl/TRDRNA2_/TRDRNA2_166501_c1_seq2.p1 gnl/TRDRNA2_/TRDRNA2_166501_c1~~gnl/TRDRNA2_/TRDRNA2_166501_c1_seq2.p1  ORF type:complete len:305 (+),score=20.06 gnl/TRDRNA2_/TRDRNA2_166501_c1_seq2:94-1008(+)
MTRNNCTSGMTAGRRCVPLCGSGEKAVGHYICSPDGHILGSPLCVNILDTVSIQDVHKVAATLRVGFQSARRLAQHGDWEKEKIVLKHAVAAALSIPEREFARFDVTQLDTQPTCENPEREIPYEAVVPEGTTDTARSNALSISVNGSSAYLRFLDQIVRAVPAAGHSSFCVQNIIPPVVYEDKVVRAPDGQLVTAVSATIVTTTTATRKSNASLAGTAGRPEGITITIVVATFGCFVSCLLCVSAACCCCIDCRRSGCKVMAENVQHNVEFVGIVGPGLVRDLEETLQEEAEDTIMESGRKKL